MTDYGSETPGYIGVDTFGHPMYEYEESERCESARRGAGGGDEGYFEARCDRAAGHDGPHVSGDDYQWEGM